MCECCESISVGCECMFVFVFCPLFCLFVWVDYSLLPFLKKKKKKKKKEKKEKKNKNKNKKTCALDTVKMIFKTPL